jgi:uncharacterized protein
MMDPALARAPGGEVIDGRRLLGTAVRFARALRAEGLAIDLGASIDFSRALGLIDLGEREQVRAAGEAIFVRRRDEIEVYERVFDRFWRARKRRARGPMPEETPSRVESADDQEGPGPAEQGDDDSGQTEEHGVPMPTSDDQDLPDDAPMEGIVVSPDAYSSGEVLRHKDFDKMTAAELRDAERLVDLLVPRLEQRRTRRYELHHHGRLLAPRAMMRRNIGTGGQLTEWLWRRAVRHPRPIVVLCDISGSMERHSRLLLRFIQALSAASEVKTESFVFGTRLTRVTRLLRDRDRDRALTRVADAVNDWAGGTRIGEAFREFNLRWARRTLRTSGIVVVVSDGWDRGDPALVATETARLRRNCHRLIWLNPLAGTPGYQPLAAGMRAAYPYIDDFLPAGTVASLERLGEILAGARRTEHRHSGEAAAAATSSAGPRPMRLPPELDAATRDPTIPRPLSG